MLFKALAVLGDGAESFPRDRESETKAVLGTTALYMKLSARSHGSNNFFVLKHMC